VKIPLYLTKPSTDWSERAGMRRAIAVLRTEAAVLRKQGFLLQPAALLKVVVALQRATAKPAGTAEAETLDWAARLENPGADFKPPKDAP
jgi:hypothetical protein